MSRPCIAVEPQKIIMDREPSVLLSGFLPKETVQVRSELIDDEGVPWTAEVSVAVDPEGNLDMACAKPSSGTYSETGLSGLFWSMVPEMPEGEESFKKAGKTPSESGVKRGHRMGLPQFGLGAEHEVCLSVSRDGQEIDRATLLRQTMPDSVCSTNIEIDRIRGVLFEPIDSGSYPGVVMISGSGGGVYREDAAVLASHGFSVLALGYFNYADLPKHQIGIPLEYFRDAILWFRQHLGHDRIGMTGPSKGGEGTLVVASSFPELVKAAVPTVPGDLYLCAVDEMQVPHAAWTLNGDALPWAGTAEDWSRVPEEYMAPNELQLFNARLNLEPFYAAADVYERAAIPVENMRCPVLLIWGEEDEAWPSKLAVERLLKRFEAHGYEYDVESLTARGAGHMFTFPGWPTTLSSTILHPLLPINMTMGGSAAGIAALQRIGWRRMVEFFKEHLAV
ncbi:acyl-CoA thioester hydrolase/BAAT C-terminal domain-containing protein [Pseudohaliea sp.]|uniref:acyl-CoA thioester hydrolase/BAAT C-terminal domain-containing protein n=1 Tax=Pseudohaliea sp. TaxID=2740289 RepID=UPI0032EE5598